jgi:hypothetical protein
MSRSQAYGFSVAQTHQCRTSATIFGHSIRFTFVEKVEVTGRRKAHDHSSKTTVVDHSLTGTIELRLGDFTNSPKFRDRQKADLGNILPQWIGRPSRRQLPTTERIAATRSSACSVPIWVQLRRLMTTGRTGFFANLSDHTSSGYYAIALNIGLENWSSRQLFIVPAPLFPVTIPQ